MNPPELSNNGLETQFRKTYIKPRIERVSLVPEETVLGGCKIAPTGDGPMYTGCLDEIGLGCKETVGVS
jgi:hypothetical protein